MLGKNGLATLAMAVLAVSVVGRAEDAPRKEADRDQPAAQQRQTTRNGATQQSGSLERHIAQCLILGNQEEIALLRFGMERTQNEKVKQLAERMIKDHEEFVEKLRKHAPGAQIELKPGPTGQATRNTNTDRTRRTERTQGVEVRVGRRGADGNIVQVRGTKDSREATAADRGNAQGAAGEDQLINRLFAIQYRAAQECLALNKECLEKEEGENFDKAFLGQQIGMHIGMLAKLKATQNEVSGDFQELITKGIATTKSHKDHIEKLMAEVHGKNGAETKNEDGAAINKKNGTTTRSTTVEKRTTSEDE